MRRGRLQHELVECNEQREDHEWDGGERGAGGVVLRFLHHWIVDNGAIEFGEANLEL